MAERFSRFRDAGTGIQVFLPPVPPVGSGSPLAYALAPLALALGVIRVMALCLAVTLWMVLFSVFGLLGDGVCSYIHSLMGRLFLLVIGFVRITSETVSLKNRGRATHTPASFSPQKGDLILSNWSSWVDVLYVLLAFNPTFVRPVVSAAAPSSHQDASSNNEATSPSKLDANARRRGAATRGQQHADVSSGTVQGKQAGASTAADEERLLGWKVVDFTAMLFETGLTPPTGTKQSAKPIEEILKQSSRPVIVFPELVTSNNRGLLRFERIFPHSWRSLYRATGALRIGKGQANIFIMSIKHEGPTQTTPSTTLSVPSMFLSPVSHILRLCFAPTYFTLTVRHLSEDESPTHSAYTADANAALKPNALTDKCADLMSSLSRLRRTDLGWQEKEAFLSMYKGKRNAQ